MTDVPAALIAASKPRVWYYKPELRWWGFGDLWPFYSGHDEFSRNTILLGWPLLGRVVIATGWCGDADCYEQSVRWLEDADA